MTSPDTVAIVMENPQDRDWPKLESRCPVCLVAPGTDHMSWCKHREQQPTGPAEPDDARDHRD
jgi:hypothetical protein